MVSTPRVTRSAILTVPNLLSIARLLLVPLLVWLIVDGRTVAATILLGLQGVTDFFDGYIARATGQVTDLGTLLDPVSDRVLVMATIVALILADTLPVWLGAPVLARDAAISVVFLGLSRRGFGGPKVRRVGKTATFALLAALPALVLGGSLRWPGLVLFAFGGVLYYVAAVRYWQDIRVWLATQRDVLG
jgi:cardiolipin synthase